MISAPEDAVRERAERWRLAVRRGEVVPSRSAIGGGSLPGETLPTWALAIRPDKGTGGVESLTARLREGTPPVMTRIEGDRALLDPRTVLPEEEGGLLRVLGAVLPG